jgi:hypothetical protein
VWQKSAGLVVKKPDIIIETAVWGAVPRLAAPLTGIEKKSEEIET